jgi:hypothetical protein
MIMKPLINLSRLARFPGDPVIEKKGPSSLTGSDRLARLLGWFSLGLGLVELLAPYRVSRAAGLRRKEGLVRGFGLREIGAGILTLSVDKQVGLLSRIAGDGLDLAVLARARHWTNLRRRNATAATIVVGAITLLDIAAAAAVIAAHRRAGTPRNYGNRTGLPKGVLGSRGLALKRAPASPDR